MRKAILQNFLIIIIVALGVSGALCYFLTSRVLSDSTKQDMFYALQLVDYNIDYSGDLKEQLDILNDLTLTNDTRLTIMDKNGEVLSDTSVMNPEYLGNHMNRAEIEETIREGRGYSKRYSHTMGTTMLYVSKVSDYGDYILRLALPYSGSYQYFRILLPAIIISFLFAFAIAVFLALGFSNTITKPLKEISEEMHKLQHRNPEFQFRNYKYSELNTIADTTTDMSDMINQTVERLEQERIIRQAFFSNVSHELKTPITSIRGYTELLESNIITNEEMKADFLRRIKKETRNMTSLIDDILMISRLETNQVEEVVETRVRIKPLLDEVLDSLAPLMAELTVTIHVDCRPLSVIADPRHIRQIFTNLLVNGVKYNNPGGKVDVIITSENDMFILKVKDDGVGIPEESIARIFERFYRVDKGRSKKMGGTGLGLSIVKHTVQFYQGTVELESELDIGTTIVVRLPILSI